MPSMICFYNTLAEMESGQISNKATMKPIQYRLKSENGTMLDVAWMMIATSIVILKQLYY